MLNKFFGLSPVSIAIDLGTVNTLIALKGYGIVLNEATAVAISDTDEREVLAVGNEAVDMCGRTPNGVKLKFPFRQGVIADYMLSEYMIRFFIQKAMKHCNLRTVLFGPRVLLCVPNCITEVERHALCDATRRAGAQEVFITEEVMAASVGANLPYREAVGSMIVDIGGGTTDAAVIALGGVAAQQSIRLGGNNIDDDIVAFIRREYNLVVGTKTAELLKISLSAANDLTIPIHMCGLSVESGLPDSMKISPNALTPALDSAINAIVTAVTDVLSATPPELAADIMKCGIVLSGGGANLYGLSKAIEANTGISVRVANSPLECVACGALHILDLLRDNRESAFNNEYSLLIN